MSHGYRQGHRLGWSCGAVGVPLPLSSVAEPCHAVLSAFGRPAGGTSDRLDRLITQALPFLMIVSHSKHVHGTPRPRVRRSVRAAPPPPP